jgi:hypothetical protein
MASVNAPGDAGKNATGELHRPLGDYRQSIAEAEAGILPADACGCGKYSINLGWPLPKLACR